MVYVFSFQKKVGTNRDQLEMVSYWSEFSDVQMWTFKQLVLGTQSSSHLPHLQETDVGEKDADV